MNETTDRGMTWSQTRAEAKPDMPFEVDKSNAKKSGISMSTAARKDLFQVFTTRIHS
jgi:hypothetical protein